MFKISSFYGSDEVETHYDNIYEIQEYPSWSRLAIGAKEEHIPLMLEIAKSWQGPYGILYVLVVSRLGHHRPGRYQISQPCTLEDLDLFGSTFQEYFERDGRHHLWLMDLFSRSQLVFDNHGIIYAYGDVAWYSRFLDRSGFTREEVKISCPHGHHYNHEMDHFEDEIMNYWDWKWFPLQDEHDDP
jgi:hypothetical protein